MNLEEKIKHLLEINNEEFMFVGYYSHLDTICWRINNSYTNYAQEVRVLNPVEEGFEKALDHAIAYIEEKREIFWKGMKK